MKQATSVILVPDLSNPEMIVAVTRRNEFTLWGMPGGKQDPGETNLTCAYREIAEETGVMCIPSMMIPIFVDVIYGRDEQHYWTTTYLYLPKAVGFGDMESGIKVAVQDMLFLTYPDNSPFSSYNLNVLGAYRKYRNLMENKDE